MKARYWNLNCNVDVFPTWLIMRKAKYAVKIIAYNKKVLPVISESFFEAFC